MRGLEAATGGDLGEAGGGRAGESCAAERGGHAGGHCCVCVVQMSGLESVVALVYWSSVVCYVRVQSCEGGDGTLAGAWMVVSSECDGGPKAEVEGRMSLEDITFKSPKYRRMLLI